MDWRTTIYFVIGLIIGVIFHEYMHGRIADILGDKTARNAGRLTLNPIPHVDIFGTVILPLALIIVRSPFVFGYAKPVPINPFFLKKPKRDMLMIAIAGPLTNFLIAFLVALIGMVVRLAGLGVTGSGFEVYQFIYSVAQINVILGFFNMIPVPPLDGSHVVEYFLSPRAQRYYDSVAPYGFLLLFAFLWLFGEYFFRWMNPVFRLLQTIILGSY